MVHSRLRQGKGLFFFKLSKTMGLVRGPQPLCRKEETKGNKKMHGKLTDPTASATSPPAHSPAPPRAPANPSRAVPPAAAAAAAAAAHLNALDEAERGLLLVALEGTREELQVPAQLVHLAQEEGDVLPLLRGHAVALGPHRRPQGRPVLLYLNEVGELPSAVGQAPLADADLRQGGGPGPLRVFRLLLFSCVV